MGHMWTAVPALALAAALAANPQQSNPTAAVDVVNDQHRKEAADHYRKGLEKMRDEAWDEAITEFRAAIRLDPNLVMAYYGLGQSRMALKQYPEAVEAFLGCIDTHKKLAGADHANRELADQRRDDEIRELRESLRLFQSGGAKSASPQNMVLRLESRLQQLENERRRGVTPGQTPAEFSLALGSAYFRSGKLADAERDYREAIKANPKMGEAHNNLAVICMMDGRFVEAEAEVKAAEKAGFPVNPRFKDDLKKRKDEAGKR